MMMTQKSDGRRPAGGFPRRPLMILAALVALLPAGAWATCPAASGSAVALLFIQSGAGRSFCANHPGVSTTEDAFARMRWEMTRWSQLSGFGFAQTVVFPPGPDDYKHSIPGTFDGTLMLQTESCVGTDCVSSAPLLVPVVFNGDVDGDGLVGAPDRALFDDLREAGGTDPRCDIDRSGGPCGAIDLNHLLFALGSPGRICVDPYHIVVPAEVECPPSGGTIRLGENPLQMQ